MSEGGSISNMVTYHDDEGRPRRSLIVTSHDTVEINVDTPQRQAFKRADLLFALGAVEERHRPSEIKCEVCDDQGGPGPLDPCPECNMYGPLPA